MQADLLVQTIWATDNQFVHVYMYMQLIKHVQISEAQEYIRRTWLGTRLQYIPVCMACTGTWFSVSHVYGMHMCHTDEHEHCVPVFAFTRVPCWARLLAYQRKVLILSCNTSTKWKIFLPVLPIYTTHMCLAQNHASNKYEHVRWIVFSYDILRVLCIRLLHIPW